MEKSLEQWKRDHEVPYNAELKVEVVSWGLGDWRSLRAPETLRIRIRWVEPRYDWMNWAQFDREAWTDWMKNGCRPPYYMYSPMQRRAEKSAMMAQLELYASVMGIDLVKPRQRRSEHVHVGMDLSGPSGNTFHYTFLDEEPWLDMEEWPDRKFRSEETDAD